MTRAMLTTADDVRNFITAGNARITIVSRRTGTRFTYRIRACPDGSGGSSKRAWWVSVLTGPDNESSFTYAGLMNQGKAIREVGASDPDTTLTVRLTKASRVMPKAPSWLAFCWLLRNLNAGTNIHPELEVWHEGRCGRCGRALTVPESIDAGIGPECSKLRIAS